MHRSVLSSAQGLLALAARATSSSLILTPASAALSLPSLDLTLKAPPPTSSSYSTQAAVTSCSGTRHPLLLDSKHRAQGHGSVPAWAAAAGAHGQPQHFRGMFIQTQPTPNPHSLMFVPGQKVMESGSHEFPDARAGMASPLAKRLFAIDGVTSVFFGSDFITITKQDDSGWAALKPLVFSAIMDHYASGQPLFSDDATLAASDTAIKEEDDEVVAMIKELLETRIRPAVQEDGGDIAFRGFNPETGIVTLKMMGACSGCPSSAVTLKSGIENMLMHYIAEVKGVEEAGPDEEEVLGIKEFEKLDAELEGKEQGASSSGAQQQQQQQQQQSTATSSSA